MENVSNTEKASVSLLSQARIASGLSLQQLTEITRIPSRYLQALESHDYDHFPSSLFVIGYLRNCADVLAVDINVLLKDYDFEKLQKASMDIDVPEHTETNRRHSFNLEKYQLQWQLRLFVGISVVALTAFFFLLAQNDQNSEDLTDQREESLIEPVFMEDEVMSDRADLIATERVLVKAVKPKLITDQTSALIELVFNGACWVDLTDARGQRVYRDLAKKGSRLAFSVKMPLELLLGDARKVEVFLNGEPFAIHAYRDDNSVRLTIDVP